MSASRLGSTSYRIGRCSSPSLLSRPVSAVPTSRPCRPHRAYATEAARVKPPLLGQPLPHTHPHLLKPGELTPGLQAAEFEIRRQNLMEQMDVGDVVISLGAKTIYSSETTDFMYLTGFNEPDAGLVLQKDNSPRGYRMVMFVPQPTSHSSLWEGGSAGNDGAIKHFQADEALPLAEMPNHLQTIAPSATTIYFDMPPARSRRSLKRTFLDSLFPGQDIESVVGKLPAGKLRSLNESVQHLRSVKSPAEIEIMRRAARISSKGHASVMGFASSSRSEADLAAHFEYACALEGSERPAYVPVVASGGNALTIHYTNNDCRMSDGELVLIDAGCELHSYCSDITRTFPVSGHFTPAQRDLYEAVLAVNKRCIDLCRVRDSWSPNQLHIRSVAIVREELKQLGFEMSNSNLQELYPHGLGHFLGMDLHDCRTVSKEKLLKAGQVITIEPGGYWIAELTSQDMILIRLISVYVPYSSKFPQAFHGIGIRIEDDVLLTEDGQEVLTSSCPKEVADVEAACRREGGLI